MQSCDYRWKVWGRTKVKHFWAIREFTVFWTRFTNQNWSLATCVWSCSKNNKHLQEVIPCPEKYWVYFRSTSVPLNLSQLPTYLLHAITSSFFNSFSSLNLKLLFPLNFLHWWYLCELSFQKQNIKLTKSQKFDDQWIISNTIFISMIL